MKVRTFDFYAIYDAPASDFGLQRAEVSDIDPVCAPIFDGRAERFRERIQHHQCYIHRLASGQIAAYFWVSTGIVPLAPWLDLQVPDGFRYIWDCKTDPRYRGQGHYTNGLRQLAQGTPCLIAVRDNPAATRAIEKAGFKFFRTVKTSRLGLTFVNGRIQFGPLILG